MYSTFLGRFNLAVKQMKHCCGMLVGRVMTGMWSAEQITKLSNKCSTSIDYRYVYSKHTKHRWGHSSCSPECRFGIAEMTRASDWATNRSEATLTRQPEVTSGKTRPSGLGAALRQQALRHHHEAPSLMAHIGWIFSYINNVELICLLRLYTLLVSCHTHVRAKRRQNRDLDLPINRGWDCENQLVAPDEAEAPLSTTGRRGWPRSQGRWTRSSDLVAVFIADWGWRLSAWKMGRTCFCCCRLFFYESWKTSACCEYDRLNGWNSTLQAAWYIRHVFCGLTNKPASLACEEVQCSGYLLFTVRNRRRASGDVS